VSDDDKPTKKPKIEFVPGSSAWYKADIIKNHPKKYRSTQLTYDILRNRAVAQLDYFTLGQKIDGAPDTKIEDLTHLGYSKKDIYPLALDYTPHWWKPLDCIGAEDYFVWNWIDTCGRLDLPISKQTKQWRDWVETQELHLARHEVLKKFQEHTYKREYDPEIQYTLLIANLNPKVTINQVTFDTNKVKLPGTLHFINNKVFDLRAIPVTEKGEDINPVFIKLYLEQRFREWIAVGGFNFWIYSFALFDHFVTRQFEGGTKFIKHFYWDLWADLYNLRLEYKEANKAATKLKRWWQFIHSEENKETQIISTADL
jgi:hypothetical protein